MERPALPPGSRVALAAMVLLALAVGHAQAVQVPDVKTFHGRELKETTYKGTLIRYFIERFTVARQKLSTLVIDPVKKDEGELLRFSEYMGEARMTELGSYVRCDARIFDQGDREKWIYRRVGSSWVVHRIFHPSRKGQVKLGPDEKLLEQPPNGEIIVEGPLPQFPNPEDYIRWMAIRVSLAKEPEVPLGQEIPMIKHVVVTE